MSKQFAPRPNKHGARIEWLHVLTDGTGVTRAGTVVGGAPALGAGHKSEVWVVPDERRASDPYVGGMIVASVKKAGSWAVPEAVRLAGAEQFSCDSDRSPTGSYAHSNAKTSRRIAEAAWYALAA